MHQHSEDYGSLVHVAASLSVASAAASGSLWQQVWYSVPQDSSWHVVFSGPER
jgi:hypothetical protein